jgi:hypothetical protein
MEVRIEPTGEATRENDSSRVTAGVDTSGQEEG